MTGENLSKYFKPEIDRDVVLSGEPLNLGFLEFLSEGVMVIDASRHIVGVNSALERLLGWTQVELVGHRCQLFLNCHDPESDTGLCENLCPVNILRKLPLKGHPGVYQDLSIFHKKGSRLVVNASLSFLEMSFAKNTRNLDGSKISQEQSVSLNQINPPVPETGDSSYYIMVLRDVTEVKRQERIQSEFITAASHQLRTPLSSIKTSIGLLLTHSEPDFNPILQRLLQNIQSSSLRMERLVNDLIELVSLQNGQVKMQPQIIEAQELVYQAIQLNRHGLDARNQVAKPLLPSRPLFVKADLLRMSQVLGHLLSNASKFSQPGQHIELKITNQPASGKDSSGAKREVVFSVKDNGIGIDPEEQALIFEKFYQSQVIENSSDLGAGLGLPLAKVLIELNNGRLWFESEPGKGSTFYFSLLEA